MPRTRSNERGQALIEVAMTLPLVLLIAVGIFEFGRAFQTWQVLTNAAREGARVSILPNPAPGAASAAVMNYLTNGGLATAGVGVAVTPATIPMGAAGSASASKVTITYPFSFIVLNPVMQLVVPGSTTGAAPFSMVVSAEMRNETQN